MMVRVLCVPVFARCLAACALFLLLGGSLQAQDVGPSEQEQALKATAAAQAQEILELRKQLEAKPAQPSLTPAQQTTLLLEAYTEGIREAPASVGAKACKAAGGKRFALLVFGAQRGWSCDINLYKVKP